MASLLSKYNRTYLLTVVLLLIKILESNKSINFFLDIFNLVINVRFLIIQ